MMDSANGESPAGAAPRVSARRLVAHALAALAYGGLAFTGVAVLLVPDYRTETVPSGAVSYVEFAGTRWAPEFIGLSAFAICIGLHFLASLWVGLVRPIAALERGEAMVVHSLVLFFSFLALSFLLLLFVSAGFGA